jgi:hypothetical protein
LSHSLIYLSVDVAGVFLREWETKAGPEKRRLPD